MTWEELAKQAVNQVTADNAHRTVKVYFDFPIDGVNHHFQITKVSDRGIMLKNHLVVDRPIGHE